MILIHHNLFSIYLLLCWVVNSFWLLQIGYKHLHGFFHVDMCFPFSSECNSGIIYQVYVYLYKKLVLCVTVWGFSLFVACISFFLTNVFWSLEVFHFDEAEFRSFSFIFHAFLIYCGRLTTIPSPKNVHVLISKICDYTILCG